MKKKLNTIKTNPKVIILTNSLITIKGGTSSNKQKGREEVIEVVP